MKIKIIFPKGQDCNFWDLKTFAIFTGKKGSGIPLALPTLAAYTPGNIEVEIIDENIQDIDFDDKADLIGISFFTAFAPRAYEIAEQYKRRKIAVVLGGIHASMLPQEAIKHADSVVIGEAEKVWAKVISDFQQGNLKKYYNGSPHDFRSHKIPRWDLVKLGSYNFFSLQATRGCPYNCEFCSVSAFLGTKCRFKPIENVVKEIEYLKSLDSKKAIVFVDDNIAASHQYAKELFRAIIPLNISWWGQASMSIAKDEEVLELMHRSGCSQIFIGFESLSQKTIDAMNKGKLNRIEKYYEAVSKIQSKKISVFGSFIVGNDCDDNSIFEKTLRFIEKSNMSFALIALPIPFPGTRLYKRLKTSGRILSEDWSDYTGTKVCFIPEKFSSQELERKHKMLMREIYSFKALHGRLSKLWDEGILVKDEHNLRARFSAKKLVLMIKGLTTFDLEQIKFLRQSLWHPNNPRFSSILSAIDFHKLVYSFALNNEV